MIQVTVNHRGRWYTIYKQDWGQDCGPTCIAIAKKFITGIGSDIDWLRHHTKAKLVSPGIQAKIENLGLQSRDTGTNISALPSLARSIGLSAESKYYLPATLLDKLKTSSHGRVFICHVGWDLGGGHFVVIPYVDPNNEVVVLDPYYELKTTNNFPRYDGGNFSGHVVEITR